MVQGPIVCFLRSDAFKWLQTWERLHVHGDLRTSPKLTQMTYRMHFRLTVNTVINKLFIRS